MQVSGKVVVVTGGANGIGRAMCEAFHRAGAAAVIDHLAQQRLDLRRFGRRPGRFADVRARGSDAVGDRTEDSAADARRLEDRRQPRHVLVGERLRREEAVVQR